MKRKLAVLLILLMMTPWLSSCTTFKKDEINVSLGVKHVEEGERAPYDGWLLTPEALELLLKEAGRP